MTWVCSEGRHSVYIPMNRGELFIIRLFSGHKWHTRRTRASGIRWLFNRYRTKESVIKCSSIWPTEAMVVIDKKFKRAFYRKVFRCEAVFPSSRIWRHISWGIGLRYRGTMFKIQKWDQLTFRLLTTTACLMSVQKDVAEDGWTYFMQFVVMKL